MRGDETSSITAHPSEPKLWCTQSLICSSLSIEEALRTIHIYIFFFNIFYIEINLLGGHLTRSV